MSRPETPLDVEVLLHEHVPDMDLEKYVDFSEDKDCLIIEIKKFMPEGWDKIMDLVASWDGEYDKPKRRWLIPKAAAKEVPAKPTLPPSQPEKTIDVKPGAEIPRFTFLPSEDILSMPFQSRQSYDDPELTDLAGSMQQLGVLEPLLVRRKPSGYELIAGHRRLAAAKQAGLKQVPCIIRDLTDQQAYEAHFIENLQRKDLTDYEKARMLDHLLKHFPEEYPTQEALAARIGKTQAWVSYHLRILDLEKDENITRVIKAEQLTEGQAREILAAPEEKRPEIARKIAEKIEEEGKAPSVRELKQWRQEGEPITWPEPEEPPGPSEPGEELSSPEREVPESKPKAEPLLTGFQIECPECQAQLLIDHREFPDGKVDHKIKEIMA